MGGPSLVATLGANISGFTSTLNQAKASAASAGSHIGEHLGGHLGAKIGAIASVAAIEQAIDKSIEYGSKIKDLSLRLGMSTDAVQVWDYALKQNGSSIDSAVGFFEKLGIARMKALKGGDEQIDDFKKLGVSIDDLRSKRVEDIAAQISEVFKVGDPQQLIGSLLGVGGKGAGEMVATLVEGFQEASAEARAFGQVLNEKAVDQLDKAGDSMTRLKTAMMVNLAGPIASGLTGIAELTQSLGTNISTYLIGPLTTFYDKFSFKELFTSPKAMMKGIVDGMEKNIEMGKEQNEKAEKEQEATEKARAERKKAGSGLKFDETNKVEEGKLAHLKKMTEEEERRGRMAAMTNKQQVEALGKEIALLKEMADIESNPEEKAKLGLEIAKRENEKGSEERKLAKELERDNKEGKSESRKPERSQANSLQQIGGFIGTYVNAPEAAALTVHKRSEGHLQKMVASTEATRIAVEKLASINGGSSVQY